MGAQPPEPSTLRMPDLEGADEITLGSWLVQPGDMVGAGQVMAEALTDKVNVEVEAPTAGRVQALLVDEGAAVKPGDAIALIAPEYGAEAQI